MILNSEDLIPKIDGFFACLNQEDSKWEVLRTFEDFKHANESETIWADTIEELRELLLSRHSDEPGLGRFNQYSFTVLNDERRFVIDRNLPLDKLAEYATKYFLIDPYYNNGVISRLSVQEDFKEAGNGIGIWRGQFIVNAGAIEFNPERAKKLLSKYLKRRENRIRKSLLDISNLRQMCYCLVNQIENYVGCDITIGTRTRHELITGINRVLFIIKRLKLAFRSPSLWCSICYFKPNVKILLQHDNEEYVKFGKFIRAELRRRKEYNDCQ